MIFILKTNKSEGKNTHECQMNFTGLVFCLLMHHLLFSHERINTFIQPLMNGHFVACVRSQSGEVLLLYCTFGITKQGEATVPLCDITKVFGFHTRREGRPVELSDWTETLIASRRTLLAEQISHEAKPFRVRRRSRGRGGVDLSVRGTEWLHLFTQTLWSGCIVGPQSCLSGA